MQEGLSNSQQRVVTEKETATNSGQLKAGEASRVIQMLQRSHDSRTRQRKPYSTGRGRDSRRRCKSRWWQHVVAEEISAVAKEAVDERGGHRGR